MNPRQYPRTLEQAFGPYARGPVHPLPEPRGYGAAWWWAMACIALVAVIVIAGCAAPPYRATGANVSGLQQAQMECEFEAEKAAASARPGLDAGWARGTVMRKCMAMKGYTQ